MVGQNCKRTKPGKKEQNCRMYIYWGSMQIPPGHISTANPIHGWTIDSHYRYGGVYACAQIPASLARRMGGDLCLLQRQTHPLCRNATTHACIMRRDCPAAEMEQRPGPFEGLVAGDVGAVAASHERMRIFEVWGDCFQSVTASSGTSA